VICLDYVIKYTASKQISEQAANIIFGASSALEWSFSPWSHKHLPCPWLCRPFPPIEAVINECGVQNAGDRAQVRGQVDGQARFVRFQLSLTSISGLPLIVVTHAIQVGSLKIHTEKNH